MDMTLCISTITVTLSQRYILGALRVVRLVVNPRWPDVSLQQNNSVTVLCVSILVD